MVETRIDLIELHDEDEGDDAFSLGARAYARIKNKLISLAESRQYNWLRILTEKGRFTFQINGVPIRFTRNKPDDLPRRKLIRSEDSEQLMLGFLEPEVKIEGVIWYIVIDTYYKSPADAIYFVGYLENGERVCQWTIPNNKTNLLIPLLKKGSSTADIIEFPTGIKQDIEQTEDVKDDRQQENSKIDDVNKKAESLDKKPLKPRSSKNIKNISDDE